MNDIEEEAVAAMRRNFDFNGLGPGIADDTADGAGGSAGIGPGRLVPHLGDAMAVMHGRRAPRDPLRPRFDVIDLDPYGSAAPFLDGAVQVRTTRLLCAACESLPL